MTESDHFINRTYFIIPILLKDYSVSRACLEASDSWERTSFSLPYLLSYVDHLGKNPELFNQYRYLHPETVAIESSPDFYPIARFAQSIPEGEYNPYSDFLNNFHISEILYSMFETNIGFLEFAVDYPSDLPVEFIIDFSYRLKNRRSKLSPGKHHFADVIDQILPSGVSGLPFFYCTETPNHLKEECICYHTLKFPGSAIHETMNANLYRLIQGYSSSFSYDESASSYSDDSGSFQFIPHPNDIWGGSQLTLVNFNLEIGDDYYLRNFKFQNLTTDYHFLYLFLLNQRLSAIHYIDELVSISSNTDVDQSDALENLNRRIIRLNTVYSLRIISNDTTHQAVYDRLFRIMNIDRLLKDLLENENQILIVQNEKNAEELQFSENITSKFLAGISILALFSALIDATDYFREYSILSPFAHLLSLGIITAFFVFGVTKVIRAYLDRKKHKE